MEYIEEGVKMLSAKMYQCINIFEMSDKLFFIQDPIGLLVE